MMDYPLLIRSILYRANTVYPESEIVTRDYHDLHRYTYRDMHNRVAKLANALARLGVARGAHIGSFAWNHHRHLELYFAVPCTERVLHTINIRLHEDQLVYTINHAEDEWLFIDVDLLPVIEKIAPQLHTIRGFVVMTDGSAMPSTSLPNAISYEDLLAAEDEGYDFPYFDEETPAIIAYTSASTGMPKGVEYTHRGLYLHCLTGLAGDIGVNDYDVSMPIVPMFHVNAWGRPYCDTWMGAKQVYPGPRPQVSDLVELIHNERVTYSAGVPTIWMGVLNYLSANPGRYDFSSVRLLLSGGSALPKSLTAAYDAMGIKLLQGYGQTETTPVTFASQLKASLRHVSKDEELGFRAKSGLLMPGLEMRLIDIDGKDVPFDGKTMGELLLRGPWVMKEYYREPEKTKEAFYEGWFRTGDIAVVDEHAYMQVVDRTRDLIKSGGEWISSVDLENAIMAHPQVAEAAVIAISHERWVERPLACVVCKPGEKLTKQEVLEFLTARVAKWWVPDDVVFLSEIPKTSVGKFSKKTLREQYERGELSV